MKSSEGKQRRVLSQRYPFNSSEIKQQSERQKRFHFNNSEKIKQPSEQSQRFHFNGSEVNGVVSVVRDVIVILMNSKSVESVIRDFMLIVMK